MRSICFVLVWSSLFVVQVCVCPSADAQEVRKALRDYKHDRVFNYSANDPWYRGKLFNVQTKHYGFFYNCDGEECKRNSPDICWKPHTDKDFPTPMGWRERIRRDSREIMQRINDGSCGPQGCSECQQHGCAECGQAEQPYAPIANASNGSPVSRLAAKKRMLESEILGIEEPKSHYGLVRGKTVPNVQTQVHGIDRPAAVVAEKRSLINRIRQQR